MSSKRLQAMVLSCATTFLLIISFSFVLGSSNPEIKIDVLDVGADLGANFTITSNPATGYVTAENDAVKVVWHYRYMLNEFNNRGGGNIYELYDKATDPYMQKNLVAVVNDGTAGTSPPKAGIGGLGATYLYEKGYNVAIGDNGGQARTISQNSYIDAAGNAVFTASFIIASKIVPSADSYRVDKKWTVFPDGQIKLEMSMTILRTFEVSQIAYNFSFNRQYGWKDAVSRRHFWGQSTCNNDGVTNNNNGDLQFSNVDQMADKDNSLMHSQSFSLYGQPSGVAASVKMDNQGQGFESGGLFSLGALLWGTTASPTSEYSNFSNKANGHTMRFYAWWAGDPPQSDRYRHITAGTKWSDTLWIEMHHTNGKPQPKMIGAADAASISETGARIDWETDSASDSRVYFRPIGSASYQVVSDNNWTPQHVIDIEGLTPGVKYEYEARSRDATGETVSSGTFTTTGVDGVSLVPTRSTVQWLDYQDYVDRNLTVDFYITNVGKQISLNTEVTAILSTSGVSGTATNSAIGNIGSGFRSPLRARYHVPMGTTSFYTTIFMRAEGPDGTVYYFPSATG